MQCASSTAMSESGALERAPDRRLEPLRRGVDELELPARSARTRSRRSSGASVELRNAARSPTRAIASTWSFMSATSGEITSVVPPRMRAGIW